MNVMVRIADGWVGEGGYHFMPFDYKWLLYRQTKNFLATLPSVSIRCLTRDPNRLSIFAGEEWPAGERLPLRLLQRLLEGGDAGDGERDPHPGHGLPAGLPHLLSLSSLVCSG